MASVVSCICGGEERRRQQQNRQVQARTIPEQRQQIQSSCTEPEHRQQNEQARSSRGDLAEHLYQSRRSVQNAEEEPALAKRVRFRGFITACQNRQTEAAQAEAADREERERQEEECERPDSEQNTSAEVAGHNTEHDCWNIINGKVYNLTQYLSSGQHPGGRAILLEWAGKDVSEEFNLYHPPAALNDLGHDAYIKYVPTNH